MERRREAWCGRVLEAHLVPSLHFLEVERAVERFGRSRQKRLDEDRRDPQPVSQIDQDASAAVKIGLGKLERLGFLDVPVGPLDDVAPDALQ